MASPALLLLAASLAWAGAPPAADMWTEVEEKEAEHDALALRFDESLKRLAELRAAYPEAPDKDVLAARWAAVFGECQTDLQTELRIRAAKRSRLNVLKFELVDQTTVVRSTRKMLQHEATASRIKAVSQRMNRDLQLEGELFQAQRQELQRQAERAAPAKVMAALFAVGLLLGGLFLWSRPSLPANRASPAAPPRPALSRTTAGPNIKLGELLGRGAMGEVYAGRDRTLDRRVAVKRLRPELSGSHSELERLIAQARLMAGLKHPNITQVHSIERDGTEAFLVLELAEGRTLARLLADEGALPWEEARRVMRAVAEGLGYAHAHGVTHGDLKPSNVMVAPDGRVKVMDFALAYAAKATVSRLTRADAFGGLPYMSPEQEVGDAGPEADAYALAACFYEALTGQLPFPGPDFLAQKRAGRYVPVSTLVKAAPAGVDSLFKLAFHADPARRFPTPAALTASAAAL